MARNNFTLETLRQLGICSYYNKQLKNERNEIDSLYLTSVHAKLGKAQTKKIVKGQTANSKKFGGAKGAKQVAKWMNM